MFLSNRNGGSADAGKQELKIARGAGWMGPPNLLISVFLLLRAMQDRISVGSNVDSGGEFKVRRMLQPKPSQINPDGAVQASFGAAPVGHDWKVANLPPVLIFAC
jgi:hypothetical protein